MQKIYLRVLFFNAKTDFNISRLMLVVKILCLSLLCFLYTNFSHAQDFHKFKFGMGYVYSPTSSDGYRDYQGLYVEPSINIKNKYALGLNLTTIVAIKPISVNYGLYGTNNDISSGLVTLSAVANRYFQMGDKQQYRVFLGIGVGRSVYSYEEMVTFDNDPNLYIVDYSYGGIIFSPRFGVNLGHFVLSGTAVMQTHGLPHFFNMQVGVEIGGGLKNKRKQNTPN